MSIIDWSDPEEMLGLLVEYVRDEQLAGRHDRERARFLDGLAAALNGLALRVANLPTRTMIDSLRDICESQPSAFAGDPVLAHVNDCIEELERIRAQE